MRKVGAVYNLGGGARVRVNAVLRGLKKIVGKRLRVRYDAPQAGDVRHTSADCTRAANALGYAPSARLAEGLRAEVEWVEGKGQRSEGKRR